MKYKPSQNDQGLWNPKVNLAIQKNKTKPETLDPKQNLEPHWDQGAQW